MALAEGAESVRVTVADLDDAARGGELGHLTFRVATLLQNAQQGRVNEGWFALHSARGPAASAGGKPAELQLRVQVIDGEVSAEASLPGVGGGAAPAVQPAAAEAEAAGAFAVLHADVRALKSLPDRDATPLIALEVRRPRAARLAPLPREGCVQSGWARALTAAAGRRQVAGKSVVSRNSVTYADDNNEVALEERVTIPLTAAARVSPAVLRLFLASPSGGAPRPVGHIRFPLAKLTEAGRPVGWYALQSDGAGGGPLLGHDGEPTEVQVGFGLKVNYGVAGPPQGDSGVHLAGGVVVPPVVAPPPEPVGVGITWALDEDERLVVSSFLPGSDAPGAGCAAGDALAAVDGVPVRELAPGDVAPLIKGTAGTKVTLTMERGGGEVQCTVERRTG